MRKKNIMRVLLIIIVVVFAYDMYASSVISDMSVVDGNNGEEVKSHEEITKDMNNKEKLDYYIKEVVKLESEMDSLKNNLKANEDTIEKLKKKIGSLKIKNDSMNNKIVSYEVKERVLNGLSDAERRDIGFKRTREAYDSAMVAYAIELCKTPNNPKNKNVLDKMASILGDYEKSNEELIGVLERIKEINSPFHFGDDAKRLIEEMQYYKKYYEKEWRIQYLDEIIAAALKIIETDGNKVKYKYDDLIKKLKGE